MELTSVPLVKRYLRLGPDDTDDDGLLQVLANAANEAVSVAVGRALLSAQYTEVRNGTGASTLVLSNTPVTAIGDVSLTYPRASASAPAQTTPFVENVDFVFTGSSIKLLYDVFPRGIANVSVEYTAGFDALPADLIHVATKWAALRYRENERLGQQSKTLQGETVLFDASELSPDMLAIVNRYQSKIPLIAHGAGLV